MTRREKILAMLAETPSDVMLRYMLAMEMSKEGELDAAVEKFRELMSETPPYVPAFHMAGQRLIELEEIEQARSVLRDGIDAARSQGNAHAAAEMADLLASLGALG